MAPTLKITIHDSPQALRLELAGALEGAGVEEFAMCCRTAASTVIGRAFHIDLHQLQTLDDHGRDLLIELHRNGAEFQVSDRQMSALVEEITGRKATRVESQRPLLERLARLLPKPASD